MKLPRLLLPICMLWIQMAYGKQVGTYTCHGHHLYFSLTLSEGENLYNVYSKETPPSCDIIESSKITGNGSSQNPYFLDVDLENFKDNNDEICGTKGNETSATLVMRTVRSATLSGPTDKEYAITCNLVTTNTALTAINTIVNDGPSIDCVSCLEAPSRSACAAQGTVKCKTLFDSCYSTMTYINGNTAFTKGCISKSQCTSVQPSNLVCPLPPAACTLCCDDVDSCNTAGPRRSASFVMAWTLTFAFCVLRLI